MPASSALTQPTPPPAAPPAKKQEQVPEELPLPRRSTGKDNEPASQEKPVPVDTNVLPIDLLSALKLTDAQNPTIGVARARLEEAYARLEQAQVGWLPNLFAGGNPYAPAGQEDQQTEQHD